MLDKQLMKNILFNLLSNASKYSGEGKTAYLRTFINKEAIRVEVEDKGIGIPDADQIHLFSPFFRAGNVTDIQGTGLGLNIVKRYVDIMGGILEFQSQLGKGTIFIVSFPKTTEI